MHMSNVNNSNNACPKTLQNSPKAIRQLWGNVKSKRAILAEKYAAEQNTKAPTIKQRMKQAREA